MGLVGKPGFMGCRADGPSLFQDKPAGLRQSESAKILAYRTAMIPAKGAGKVDRVDMDLLSHGAEADGLGEAFVQKIFGRPQPSGASRRTRCGRDTKQRF